MSWHEAASSLKLLRRTSVISLPGLLVVQERTTSGGANLGPPVFNPTADLREIS